MKPQLTAADLNAYWIPREAISLINANRYGNDGVRSSPLAKRLRPSFSVTSRLE